MGSEFLLDDLSDSLSGPDIAPKSEVLGTFLQKRGKLLRPLLLGKFWRAARPRRCLQGLLAPLTCLFHPVAYRAVADAERLSNERSVASLSVSVQTHGNDGLRANQRDPDPWWEEVLSASAERIMGYGILRTYSHVGTSDW